MIEKLIKLASLIPYISEYIYKVAGLKDDLISKYPQYKEQILQLSDKGIEDSFLFSAVNLLDYHNKPKQKSELDKERREQEAAERAGKVYIPNKRITYDVDQVYEIIMKKQTEGKSKYLVNELGFNQEAALKLIELFNKRASFIGKKIYEDVNTGRTFSAKKIVNLSKASFELLQDTYYLSFINDYIVVGLSGDLEYIRDSSIHYIFELAEQWHEELEASAPTENYEETHEIVLDFRNPKTGLGFYWAKLGKGKSQEESDRMGHCGNSSGNTLYSLREYSKNPINNILINESHITLSLSDHGIVRQCKGKKNSKPALRFSKYIMELISLKNADSKYLINGFESEYDQSTDFSLSSLPTEILENTYLNRPEIFSLKDCFGLYSRSTNLEIKKSIFPKGNFNFDTILDSLQNFISLDDYTASFIGKRFDEDTSSADYLIEYGYGHYINNLPVSMQQAIYNASDYKDTAITFEEFVRLLANDSIGNSLLSSIVSDQYFDQFNDELVKVIIARLRDFGEVTAEMAPGDIYFTIEGNLFNLASASDIAEYLEKSDYSFADTRSLLESLIADDVITKADKIDLNIIEHRFYLKLDIEQAKNTLEAYI